MIRFDNIQRIADVRAVQMSTQNHVDTKFGKSLEHALELWHPSIMSVVGRRGKGMMGDNDAGRALLSTSKRVTAKLKLVLANSTIGNGRARRG